jgi:hypothetical protein
MAYNNKGNYNNGNYNNFDLNNYETVKSRKVRLRNDHPNAFILPFPMSDLNYAGNYIVMGALIWKDKKVFDELEPSVHEKMANIAKSVTPQNAGLVLASIAVMAKADGAGYSLSMAGGKGADKNAWVENAEESAVGRALDNMGYHSGSASQEEMKKVQHMQQVQQERVRLENQINAMYGQLISQGHNPQYLAQVISQTVKQFNHLSELSIDELDKLLNALQAVGGQSAYQQQAQQQSASVNVPVPGAPAPVPR